MTFKPPVKIPVQEYCDRLSKHLVSEVFKQLAAACTKGGQPIADQVTVNFLSDYVEAVVFRVLAEVPSTVKSNREAYEFATRNLSNWKRSMQEGIAMGFARAMSAYSGHDIDYLCKITPVPEIKSTNLPN